ncbi:MAG: hypothetical protein ACP5T3_03440 [Candidatus Micrarchaeia archaeon]
MNASRVAYVVLGLIILGLLAYLAATYTRPSVSPVTTVLPGYTVMAQLTDPAHVPNGTQSLNMSYSSVRFHAVGAGVSQWYNTGASGKINLLGLVNISKTLGTATIPLNSIVDEIAFNITGMSITINGTTYPVAVPNSTVLVHLQAKVNASSSILADLTPTVVTIITNSSQPVFVMVPSVKAIIIPGVNASASATGYAPVSAAEHEKLERIAPNITITSAKLSSVDNITSISITVKNNANTSATLRNLLIYGNESMQVYFNLSNGIPRLPMPLHQPPMPSVISTFNTSSVNVSKVVSAVNSIISNSSLANVLPVFVTNTIGSEHSLLHMYKGNIVLNESAMESMAKEMESYAGQLNGTEIEDMFRNIAHNSSFAIPALAHMNYDEVRALINSTQISSKMEIEHMHFRVFNFLIAKNGSLVLPFSAASAMNEYYGGGYTISPGASATLTFSGEMTLGNSNIVMTFTPGSSYKIVLVGDEGARAVANVTAS